MKLPNIIAIDGPAASGKSTVGAILARDLGYLFFDTGVMYRAVTLAAINSDTQIEDEAKITHLAETIQIDVNPPSLDDGRAYDVLLDGCDVTWDIRLPEVNCSVSPVSAYRGVRLAMTKQQRRIGMRGNVVMVGRDIGSVVCPEAELKIYLDASIEERSRRRLIEMQGRGKEVDYKETLDSLIMRDRIDSTRTIAPLKITEDAIVIYTDKLSIEEVVMKVKELIKDV
ncbi:MAG: (d)CMP kinase [Chloroflexota bacterium]